MAGKRLRNWSTIDELPTEAREKLEGMLTDPTNGLTYNDMVAIMAEDGYALSKSAICRYARRKLAYMQRIQQMQEQTRLLLDYLGDNPGADLARQINGLIQTGLMFKIAEGQDEIEGLSIKDAMKLSIAAQRAAVYEYRYRDQTLQREAKEAGEDDRATVDAIREILRERPELAKLLADTNDLQASDQSAEADASPGGEAENI